MVLTTGGTLPCLSVLNALLHCYKSGTFVQSGTDCMAELGKSSNRVEEIAFYTLDSLLFGIAVCTRDGTRDGTSSAFGSEAVRVVRAFRPQAPVPLFVFLASYPFFL
eukprot:455777-Rhodomonas_salina.1